MGLRSAVLIVVLASLAAVGAQTVGGAPGGGSGVDALADTAWTLERFELDGVPLRLADAPITLEIGADGARISGSGGCNRYSGMLGAREGEVTVSPLAATMMACADELSDLEQSYLTALQSVARAERSGDRLVLLGAEARLVFAGSGRSRAGSARPPSAEPTLPAGSRWTLHALGPAASSLEVADGTVVTLEVADGGLAGSAGCNRYRAALEVMGDAVAVDTPLTTRRACAEAVMAQEAAYLRLLEGADHVARSGDELTLRGAGGVLVFRSAEAPPVEDLVSFRSLDPETFNLRLGGGAADPLAAALAAVDLPDAPTVRVVREDDRTEAPTRSVVTIAADRLPDDAVAGTLLRLAFVRGEDGRWSVVGAFEAVRCRRGADPDAYVAGPCP